MSTADGADPVLPRRVAGAGRPSYERFSALTTLYDRQVLVVIDTVLSELRLLIPGVHGCVLGGVDGLLITHNLPDDSDPSDLAALAATTFGLGRQVGLRLGQGGFRESTVRNQQGYLSVYTAGERALLAVVGADTVNVARLHLHAPVAADRLAALLAADRES
ncbi:roadblock/LC7 domain-containing protein [Micromonospora sp. NBC_01699]|uniref:roadblock/LC7 domain-containing protein n=1 Tax=Micromonospora sp. NBC_01699 TaxID=2975984 RepID=UPI002E2C2FD0|nr:roadblock/LC7 domain-containing protein [Micromonospora sp. NBC_01699]